LLLALLADFNAEDDEDLDEDDDEDEPVSAVRLFQQEADGEWLSLCANWALRTESALRSGPLCSSAVLAAQPGSVA